MKKYTVALIFGGMSVEHEVSVISGIQALSNFNTDKYDVIPVYMDKSNNFYIGNDIGNIEAYRDIDSLLSRSTKVAITSENDAYRLVNFPIKKFGKNFSKEIDVVFPVVHGTNVEDGSFQGYLKTIGVPFVGCDVLASSIGMDKYIMKSILKNEKIPVLDALLFSLTDYEQISRMKREVENAFCYPVIVKPVNLGSSIGINIAWNSSQLETALDEAFRYSTKVLVEKAVENLREINCSVLGDDEDAIASECEEPIQSDKILSYKDKYMNNSKSGKSEGMASVSRIIPAKISDEMKLSIQKLAIGAFKALRCNGVARIDFIVDTDDNSVYFNEINTIPGSLAFYLWEPCGVDYKELLDRLVQLSLKRKRVESSLLFSFDTNILDKNSFNGIKGGKV